MSAPRPACWCCGRDVDENVLLRLGAHPEAGVCPDCAQHLHRRATEHADRRRAFHTPGSLARTATRTARDKVVSRGWHQHPALGPLLRALDRHLP